MSWLNYQHLFYFRTIAKQGSIAKASEKLRLGQSALSIQLKLLEDHFQQKLFERKNRGLSLTEAGKIALDYADSIFQLGDELGEMMNDKSFSPRSRLQIAALEGIPKKLIQFLIEAAQKKDSCTVTVRQGEGDLIFRELLAHRVDLVISDYQPTIGDAKKFHIKHLVKAPVSIFGVRKFQNLKRTFPDSIKGQPIILPTFQNKLRHDLDHYFRINNFLMDVVIETSDTSVQKILAMEGMGLIAIPECAVHSLVEEGKLVKIGSLPEVTQDFFLIHSPRKFLNPLVLHLAKTFQLAI